MNNVDKSPKNKTDSHDVKKGGLLGKPGTFSRKVNVGCLIIIILLIIFIIMYSMPGFIAFRQQKRVDRIGEGIRTALEAYADNHPEHRYPEDIPNYAALRAIVNKHGGSLPEKQSDVDILHIRYILDDSKNYSIEIKFDLSLDKFLIVTPKGITRNRTKIITSSMDYKAKEIAQDRDYKAKEIAQDSQFIVTDEGIVKDKKTGLEWIAGPDEDTNWNEAKTWVRSQPGYG